MTSSSDDQTWDDLKIRLREYVQYINGGHPVYVISQEMLAEAEAALLQQAQSGFKCPGFMTSPDSDTHLGCYWRAGLDYISIDFNIQGGHLYGATDGSNVKTGHWLVGGKIPQDLMVQDLTV